MKKTLRLIALAVMLIMGSQTMAQNRTQNRTPVPVNGSFLFGASFPTGNFANGDAFTHTAIGGNYNDGGAGIGFNAGFKLNIGVNVRGLSVMITADGFYNGPNADMKEYYKQVKTDLERLNSNVIETTPKFINAPVMFGLNYRYDINPNFGIYAEAGVGGNVRFITNYTCKGTSRVLGLKNEYIYDYEHAFSFAWQAGLGIEVSRTFVIACNFYDLGSAMVKGNYSAVYEGVDSPVVSCEYGKLRPVMVVGRIGFKF